MLLLFFHIHSNHLARIEFETMDDLYERAGGSYQYYGVLPDDMMSLVSEFEESSIPEVFRHCN